MKASALDKTFEFEGKAYHFRRELKDGKLIFTVFCGEEQVLHPEISTAVSDSIETIATFDHEHGRGAYEAFTCEKLMNLVTHMIPLADKR